MEVSRTRYLTHLSVVQSNGLGKNQHGVKSKLFHTLIFQLLGCNITSTSHSSARRPPHIDASYCFFLFQLILWLPAPNKSSWSPHAFWRGTSLIAFKQLWSVRGEVKIASTWACGRASRYVLEGLLRGCTELQMDANREQLLFEK